MSEMAERVAKAICAAQSWMLPWDEIPAEAQDGMRNVARAAIAAMREPTDKMVEAGLAKTFAVYVWPIMIDEALKDA